MTSIFNQVFGDEQFQKSFDDAFDSAEVANDFEPLPPGTYTGHIDKVEPHAAKTGTPGLKVSWRIAEGDHTGRVIFDTWWLTPAAMSLTKRNCVKIGLATAADVRDPKIAPGTIRCSLKIVKHTEDNGDEYNRVRRFEVVGTDSPPSIEDDQFAPREDGGEL